jgi:hypothetical protein
MAVCETELIDIFEGSEMVATVSYMFIRLEDI